MNTMKKLAVFLCSILLSISFLGSCGMTTDSIEIESVKAVLNEETGATIITIKYLDDIEDPLVFEIPAGQQGVAGLQGVGISRIETIFNEKNERTGIRIYFTDESLPPFEAPFTDGKDGVSIKDVQSEIQADGSIKLTFLDDNNNVIGAPVFVPSGTEITDITSNTLENGALEIKVFYSNGVEPIKFTLDAARGVRDISTSLENNQYVITFTYTDGTTSTVSFDRPAAWLSGYGRPNHANGLNGDFYFDLATKLIYQKVNGVWGGNGNGEEYVPIADLNPNNKKFTVKFVIEEEFTFSGAMQEYTFSAGESFATKKYSVPVATKTGYEFLGWYTIPGTEILTVNHGRFTDLTPISGDLTLYAHWKKISG